VIWAGDLPSVLPFGNVIVMANAIPPAGTLLHLPLRWRCAFRLGFHVPHSSEVPQMLPAVHGECPECVWERTPDTLRTLAMYLLKHLGNFAAMWNVKASSELQRLRSV
jgi:hypothetical protein